MTTVAVLGASGLIGGAIAVDLKGSDTRVLALARSFTAAQKAALGESAIETPLLSLDDAALAALLAPADIIVNCIGVLQAAPGIDMAAVHRAFPDRLAAICAAGPKLLLHVSVPGEAHDDRTDYAHSKRDAEIALATSAAPHVVLRPGFVIAPAAFGGSAVIRALAMAPLRLPSAMGRAPFAAIAIADICETVACVANRWQSGERQWRARWDLMAPQAITLQDVVESFRRHLGGPRPLLTPPGWAMTLGAWSGDALAWLGWRPPIRTTALAELRRGVRGDPSAWMAATGITPRPLAAALPPATVQERWFARLYLLKGMALAALVLFWCVSGLIALTVAFAPARAILLDHGFTMAQANAFTIVTSLMDISVGLAIAWQRTCRVGLMAGILISLGYMAGCALITPELWIEPLGALVKTGPAIVLMLLCLAMLDNR
jgi:uncharacterized protein YbjT (DUF2867 family)